MFLAMASGLAANWMILLRHLLISTRYKKAIPSGKNTDI